MHNSEKTHCIKGHEFTIDNIYRRYDSNGRRCKKCERDRMKIVYKNRYANRYKNNYRIKKWKLFNQILDYYGRKCNCSGCSETRVEFLTVDHINNDGAKHRNKIKGTTLKVYQDVIDQGFPDTYQILCHNCNWGRSRYGVCPHQS